MYSFNKEAADYQIVDSRFTVNVFRKVFSAKFLENRTFLKEKHLDFSEFFQLKSDNSIMLQSFKFENYFTTENNNVVERVFSSLVVIYTSLKKQIGEGCGYSRGAQAQYM